MRKICSLPKMHKNLAFVRFLIFYQRVRNNLYGYLLSISNSFFLTAASFLILMNTSSTNIAVLRNKI